MIVFWIIPPPPPPPPKKKDYTFPGNRLQDRQFACKVKSQGKIRKKNILKFRLLKILPSMLSVNAIRNENILLLSHSLYALNKYMSLFITSVAGLHLTQRSDLGRHRSHMYVGDCRITRDMALGRRY